MGEEIVGIDIGKGYVKFFSEGKQGIYPSIVGVGTVTNLEGKMVDSLVLDGQAYTLGSRASLCEISWSMDDKKSDLNSLIHVLNVSRRHFTADVIVCGVGLPTGNYEAEKQKLKEMLSGKFTFQIDGEEKTVELVSYVIPEGLGAYYFCTNGGVDNVNQILIVDIGYKTLDTIIAYGTSVSYKGWGSLLLGVEKVVSLISKGLSKKYGIVLPEEKARINKAIAEYCADSSSCKIIFKTKELDITELTQEALRVVSKEIVKNVQNIAEENAVENIAFCGGGSILFKQYLQSNFPNAIFFTDIFANAKGFYYLAKRKHLANKARELASSL